MSFIGAFRVDNPSTGVPADADEGFAVCVTNIARVASQIPKHSDLDKMVEKRWSVSSYLKSPGAVRKGTLISLQEVIEYFRNYVGGAHHDLLSGKRKSRSDKYELIADLSGHVKADVRDGLYFELLSIGQSVARSPDIRLLSETIRCHHHG